MPLSRVKPSNYENLLRAKSAEATALLSRFGAPEPQVFASQATGFRMRAEFRMWHEGDALDFVMFHPEEPRKPVVVDEFPIACQRIQELMPVLRDRLRANEILRRKLFQVEFLSTLAGDTLLTLVYHRRLEADWEAEAATLGEALEVSIVGRSRRQKLVVGRDYVEEVLAPDGKPFRYRQYEQAFTQPNAMLNVRMLEWACAQASSLQGDLLELYCGNGNFTLPLSRHFDQVIATELAKSSIRAARENLLANGIDNVAMIRLSAEEVTQAMRGVREFRRLGDLPQPLQAYSLDTIFVDPPRAGLDSATVQMASEFASIIYISCNPHSLAQNLESLCQTHRVQQCALFDQFPYTDHLECGVFLQRG